MLDRFVRENEQITEDLQLSMDKSPLKLGTPFPQCEDAGKTLSSLRFSLRFTGRGSREGQACEDLLFFVDDNQQRASGNVRLRIADGEAVQCAPLLDARMSAATRCCLAVQEADGADDALQMPLLFSMQMSLTTDSGF